MIKLCPCPKCGKEMEEAVITTPLLDVPESEVTSGPATYTFAARKCSCGHVEISSFIREVPPER